MVHLIGWGFPSGGEWIIVAIVAVLLFGKRLPEVGKSLGKGIVEFKKGLRGIEEDVDQGINSSASTSNATPTTPRALPSDYKFDPATGEPVGDKQPSIARESKSQYRFDPYTGQPLAEKQTTDS